MDGWLHALQLQLYSKLLVLLGYSLGEASSSSDRMCVTVFV